MRRVALLLLTLTLVACFEEPVREELELRFGEAGDQRVAIDLGVTLMPSRGEMENRLLRNRLSGERARFLRSEDDWTPRFERIDPPVHEVTFTHEDGELSEVRQSADLDLGADPDAVRRFFSDTLVDASYRVGPEGDGQTELSFQPLATGRETVRQRQLLDRSIDPWTESVARYFRTVGELYSYLAEHPERAPACYSILFEDVLPEEERGDRDDLLPTERHLIENAEEAMAAAWSILEIGAQEAYSINEISRLAYDPFPARLRVVPAGPVVAVEGFEEDGDGGYRVPSVTLWDALRDLEGEWLAPDPLLMLARAGGEELGIGDGWSGGGEPPTLGAILAIERFHPPAPRASEIRTALEARLSPSSYYRLVWEPGS